MRRDFEAIYDNPAGTRRAIITRGRKNAKTTESAMLLLLHLCGPEAKPNSQLNSAAQSRDQAAILFQLAAKMVRLSADLSAVVTIRDTAKQLHCSELGTLYRALSADASNNLGLSPSFIVHDELGQVRGPRSALYEALETATAAQDSPLSIIISTQSPNDGDLLSILIDDAETGADSRTVLRMDTAPPELDAFSLEAIKAANPAFGVFMNEREVLDMRDAAERMPSRQPDYENLVLNRRVEMNAPFVSRIVWQKCGAEVNDDWGGCEVYAGLDLSAVNDLTALVRVANVDGVWQVLPTFWLPKVGLAERARQDRQAYDLWASRGFIETTPGNTIEYEWVAERLAAMHREQPFRRIAFDRWNYRHFKPWLARVGFADEELDGEDALFKPFGQGFESMSPALLTLESLLLGERLAHGNHPVLSMCAANATIETNAAGGRKLAKHKSHGRIDGMVALAMAAAIAAEEYSVQSPSYLESATMAFV